MDSEARKQEMEVPLLIPESENERRKSWDEVFGEVKRLIVLAGPLMSVNLLLNSQQVISIMFVGHLGELSLAGASLATSFASVTGFSLMVSVSRLPFLLYYVLFQVKGLMMFFLNQNRWEWLARWIHYAVNHTARNSTGCWEFICREQC